MDRATGGGAAGFLLDGKHVGFECRCQEEDEEEREEFKKKWVGRPGGAPGHVTSDPTWSTCVHAKFQHKVYTFDLLGWQQVLHCIMVKAAGSPALSSCCPPVHLEEPSESD